MSLAFRIFAGCYLLIMGIIGELLNGKVAWMLTRSSFKNGFHFFCRPNKPPQVPRTIDPKVPTVFRARALTNCCILSSYVFWTGPVTLLNFYYLPPTANVYIGLFSGQFAYSLSPLLSICLTFNRLFAVFLPLSFRSFEGKIFTIACLVICFILAIIPFLYGLLKPNCAFVYELATLSWIPQSECTIGMTLMTFYVTLFMCSLATVLNVLTFLKLAIDMKTVASSDLSSKQRNSKNARMLVQNVIQDLLYVVDSISALYALSLSQEIWYQFIMGSALWLTHIVLDGAVMYWCNRPRLIRTPTTSLRRGNNSTLNTVNIN